MLIEGVRSCSTTCKRDTCAASLQLVLALSGTDYISVVNDVGHES